MHIRAAPIVGTAAAFIAVSGVALYVSLGWPKPTSIQADPADPAQVAVGQRVYDAACASCHGKNLEGEENWQSALPTGGLPAPPHDESGHTWHHPDQILFRITKFGGAAEAPAGFKSNMPAFGDRLTDDEIRAVLAYIKSRWPAPIQARQAEINRRYGDRR